VTDLNDKGRAEEAKAALAEEVRFKAEARRNKRVGLWFAADVLDLPADQRDDFASKTIDADFEEKGDEDVIRFLKAEATNAGKPFDEALVREKMVSAFQAALAELTKK